MYLFKYSILVLFLSLSFCQKNSLSDNNIKSNNNTKIEKVKKDPIKIWEEEDNNIENPELKIQLESLRREFETKRNDIQNNYKSKIKALKEQSRSEIDFLKKNLMTKRNALKKQYGVKKPKKIKDDNKVKPEKINKPKTYNPPKGVKPTKTPPSKPLDDNSKSKVVPGKDIKNDKK